MNYKNATVTVETLILPTYPELPYYQALCLTGLLERYMGNDVGADRRTQKSFGLNNDNLFARIM